MPSLALHQGTTWQLLLEVLAAAAAAADRKCAVAAASHPPDAGERPAALCPAAAVGGDTPEVHSAVGAGQLEARFLWWVVQLFHAWVAQLDDSSELLSQALL